MRNAVIQTEIFVIFLALLISSTERDGGKPASEELKLNWNLLSDIGLLNKDPKSMYSSFQILFLSLMEIQQSIGKLIE
jgi:hypothetical protein